MASGPQAESSSHDETFAELARRIQSGDQTAVQNFHSTFLPGIEFLLRRKLGKSAVAAEAAQVVTAAVQEIEGASLAQSINLSQLVIRTICALFPAASGDLQSPAEETPLASLAHSVLAEKTPLEQNILRRYYVLGESPDKIRTHLRVSARTIEETIARARADFRSKVQRSEPA